MRAPECGWLSIAARLLEVGDACHPIVGRLRVVRAEPDKAERRPDSAFDVPGTDPACDRKRLTRRGPSRIEATAPRIERRHGQEPEWRAKDLLGAGRGLAALSRISSSQIPVACPTLEVTHREEEDGQRDLESALLDLLAKLGEFAPRRIGSLAHEGQHHGPDKMRRVLDRQVAGRPVQRHGALDQFGRKAAAAQIPHRQVGTSGQRENGLIGLSVGELKGGLRVGQRLQNLAAPGQRQRDRVLDGGLQRYIVSGLTKGALRDIDLLLQIESGMTELGQVPERGGPSRPRGCGPFDLFPQLPCSVGVAGHVVTHGRLPGPLPTRLHLIRRRQTDRLLKQGGGRIRCAARTRPQGGFIQCIRYRCVGPCGSEGQVSGSLFHVDDDTGQTAVNCSALLSRCCPVTNGGQ